MSGLTILTLGVGDAFSALHYSSCVAIHADGRWLLIDCPHPLRKILREAATTAGVAAKMYEERDFTGMPVLADALEEAGCDNADSGGGDCHA